MASMSPVSATTVVYFFRDSSNVITLLLIIHSQVFGPDGLEVLTIALGGDRAIFKLSDLGQPTAVPVRAAELGLEEVLRAIPCDRNTHGPASEADNIHVVVLYPLPGREVILTECRAYAIHLVGSHGGAHTAAAHENASLHLSSRYSAREWDRKVRVVVVYVIYFITKINDLMSFRRQQPGELSLHLESTVICSYTYFHLALPCRAIWLFAAAATFSTLKPNFFKSCLRGADAPKVSMPML